MLFAAVHESGPGTELPVQDVSFHGEFRRMTGRPADVPEMAKMTQLGHRTDARDAPHNSRLMMC